MIKIIVALIPLLAFGYIMYDFFGTKIKKKKKLIKLRVELTDLLNTATNGATHSLQIMVSSTDEIFNGTRFTIWCRGTDNGTKFFFNPISMGWVRYINRHDIVEYLTYGTPFRGDVGFRNKYQMLGHVTKIPTIKPTKSIRKHSFTH